MALKRKLVVVLSIAGPALLLIVIFLLSSPMLRRFQHQLDADPDIESASWKQFALGQTCSATFRPQMAATAYRRFYERFHKDERRPLALLRWSENLEAAGRSADAKELYTKFLVEYPDHELRKDAERGLNRIAHVSR